MQLKRKLFQLLDLKAYKRLFAYSEGRRKMIASITLMSIATSLISVASAVLTKRIVDYALVGNMNVVKYYGLMLGFFLILELALSGYASYIMLRYSEAFRNQLQRLMLEVLYNKKWLEINRYKTGDLLTRLYTDINNTVTVFMSTIPQFIALILQLVVAFSILCYYDPMLAILTFLISPVTIFIGMYIGSKLKRIQHDIQVAEGLKQSIINESIQNIVILKTFDYTKQNIAFVQSIQNNHFSLLTKKNSISIKANLMLGLGYRLGFFGAVAIGAYRLSVHTITFGTFTAFSQLVVQIQGPIQLLSRSIPQFIATLSSVERIDEIHDLKDDNVYDEIEISGTDMPCQIVVENVSFYYKKEHPVLTGVSLEICRGEKIAIVGPSGEGKTTLISILLALIEPSDGRVQLVMENGDKIQLSSYTRRFFSYVPQNNALFSGSILSNFLISKDVSHEAIDRALIASCCKEFIDELPEGLNTKMGERGIGLSQGQVQRLTIARALIHNTPFLVFDEATSALDVDTEKHLIENLRTLYPETTLIAITHRESVFEICDKIYRLKNGNLNLRN